MLRMPRWHSGSCLNAEGLTLNWTMRQDKRSPCYTTRWEDLMKVR
ncbi:hypothetical protein CFN79_09395 [Chromobacterium vaccinii]|nr:hypothetical protein CFN79_09395 [Chromobacterium vaccinii]